mgnify:CR=1 FL=1
MNRKKIKVFALDLLIDCLGGFLITTGIYNFATASGFPVTGISGIAQVLFFYFKLPIGLMTILMNIPIILFCGRILGLMFTLRSIKTLLIVNFFMDVIAPLLPIYRGDILLSAICMGLLAGTGYALIYMRNTSTGGVDFITMTIRAKHPHLSLGRIIIFVDCFVLLLCGSLMGGDVDKILYGLISTSIVSIVVDKVMYGLDAGKVTLIVTEHGPDIVKRIHEMTERGATLIKATGGYSKEDKHIVMCACSYKQMHMVQKAVKEVDYDAFLITMEANQVRGRGFRPH